MFFLGREKKKEGVGGRGDNEGGKMAIFNACMAEKGGYVMARVLVEDDNASLSLGLIPVLPTGRAISPLPLYARTGKNDIAA